jgi:glycosyltransferase involved in cell wall biosynthesis
VVTPTLHRSNEVRGMLLNLAAQTVTPAEVFIIDAAGDGDTATADTIATVASQLPFRCEHLRHGGGTAIQRNVGIDRATGDFIAFIDDDIRLEASFFETMLGVLEADREQHVGGVAGYITNQHLNAHTSRRWRWYRRLHLFSTYEPGRYDFQTGYPINRYLQAPHEGTREIDFMGSNCAVWRRAVFASGLRFSEFFTDYGVLEDAHLALRARPDWVLLECGRARCIHLRAGGGRADKWRVAWKTAVNYRYVFVDIVRSRSWRQELRFWSVQGVDLIRYLGEALRTRKREDWRAVAGKIKGITAAFGVQPSLMPGSGRSTT